MKNKEKYAKEIAEIATLGYSIAVDNKTKEVCKCVDKYCKDCYLYGENYNNDNSCVANRIHWANSEYKERKEFTEQEKAVIRPLDKVKWVAKDRNGETYGFKNKPYKSIDLWKSDSIIDSIFLSGYSSCEFKTIKWEDNEPTSREEILGEEK